MNLRSRFAVLVATAALLAQIGVAAAADDAGTRSIFSTGSGMRALALGGAFTAIADDASSPLWNPGGLGLVDRGELQVGQTQYELDFHETMLAAAYPDWRWGAVAMTIRHFGTSDIEGRDERNLVTDASLSSSESEVGIAYGRSVSPAWSLGGMLKLRRQEVAGRAGSGVGADLGVHVVPALALGLDGPWTRGLALGLALQNVVEPSIRLDQESVSDPSAVRMGLALAPPFAGSLGMLFSFDVDKAQGVSPRVHAGLELRPYPLFALRGGLDQGTLTAGTGFRYKDAEIEYAFADQTTGATHRAGLTYHFGAPVGEARERASQAAEDQFSQRLAEIEQQRDAERIQALLSRAEDARQRGDIDEGLSLVATIRVIEPEHAAARALEAGLLADRGRSLEAADPAQAAVAYQQSLALAPADTMVANALSRSRAASNARAQRSQQIRERFAAALEAFGADRLAPARDGFAAVLAADPNDREAGTMLARTERAIATKVQDLLRRAELLAQAGQTDEATALIGQARELDPKAAGLAAASTAVDNARAQRAARATPAPSGAPEPKVSPVQERELAAFYRRGLEAFQAGRTDEALRYWELVWSLKPGYQRVDEYLKREYLTRGMEHFAAGRLIEAVSMWERALQVDPKDPRTIAYLARAHEQLERARQIGGDKP
jgi:tetratricopeptide (TPR) repeat protein